MISSSESAATTASRRATTGPREDRTAEAHLFLVLQCDRPLRPSARYCLSDVRELVIGRGSEREGVRVTPAAGGKTLLAVPDAWVSTTHAVIRKSEDRWIIVDAGSKNGTLVNGRITRTAELKDGDLIELGQTFFLFRESLATWATLPAFVDAASLRPSVPGLLTLVPSLADQLERVPVIAPSPVSVVIRGETGTGKEVGASAIHQLSRRTGPFVAVNCASLPDSLVQSELFGYLKGAFTGAAEDRPGLIRGSDKGTLFLDEIGDLPSAAQAILLRVLQEGEVLPIGGRKPIKVDIRLVVATHQDLQARVATNQFRADLLARVSGWTLSLPPLRERREDLGILIGTLIRRHAPGRPEQVAFSCDAARALLRYHWPLNVRELEKCLMAALVLASDGPIRPTDLPGPVQAAIGSSGDDSSEAKTEPLNQQPAPPRLSERDQQQMELVVKMLQKHSGNITAVAQALGKARGQVRRWIKRYGIDSTSFRR